MEHSPILTPGFYDVPFNRLKETLTELLVRPFIDSRRRELLLGCLLTLLEKVAGVWIFTEVWIDGSFVTDKEEPNDIDIVLWYNTVASLSPRDIQTYRELHDNNLMMSCYRCDVYLATNENHKLRRYWENWFGCDRTGHPKGIVRVTF